MDGDSRLIGGATSAEGLLETCFNGVYWLVNAEEFTVLEASTVCRQLGIATGMQVASVAAPQYANIKLYVMKMNRNLMACTISSYK